MGQVSLTVHLSSKKNAICTVEKLKKVAKHNDRDYHNDTRTKSEIERIIGSNNTYADVVEAYKVFEPARESFNKAQKREDRKINNYLKHVSDSRNDVAAEIILQLGDKDFWKDKLVKKQENETEEQKELREQERAKIKKVFEGQIAKLQKLVPNFKIANAVIHWDEESPHVQIVGVPICKEYKKGMSWQCAKTRVFTDKVLEKMQEEMHNLADEQCKDLQFACKDGSFEGLYVKEAEAGRNVDFTKTELAAWKKLEANIRKRVDDELALQKDILELQGNTIAEQDYEIRNRRDYINDLDTIIDANQRLWKARDYIEDKYPEIYKEIWDILYSEEKEVEVEGKQDTAGRDDDRGR